MSFNRIISRIPAVVMRSMRTTPSSAAAASVLASSSSTSTTPIRFFASGGGGKKQKKPEDLATILANELEYEKNEAEPRAPLTEVKESMKEWTFKDEVGSARFSCSKNFGSQEIRVDLDCTPMPVEDDEAEFNEEDGAAEEQPEQGNEGFRLLVSVTQPGSPSRTMLVGAFITDHLRIHRVTLLPTSKIPSADTVFGGFEESPLYAGPNFDELDQAVQNGFYEYLQERGIDDSLAEKLSEYCAAKEQTEYLNWLTTAAEFAAGGVKKLK